MSSETKREGCHKHSGWLEYAACNVRGEACLPPDGDVNDVPHDLWAVRAAATEASAPTRNCMCGGIFKYGAEHGASGCEGFETEAAYKRATEASALTADEAAAYHAVFDALQPHMLSGEDAVSCVKRLVEWAGNYDACKAALEEVRDIIGSGGGSITEAALRLKAHSMLPSAAAARPAIRGLSAASPHFRRSNAEEFSDFD